MKKEIKEYLEDMISSFCEGNDNEYEAGTQMSFIYEEIEMGNPEIYYDEDVDDFYETRQYIIDNGGKIKFLDVFNDEELEYTFEIVNGGKDIKCSWIEP